MSDSFNSPLGTIESKLSNTSKTLESTFVNETSVESETNESSFDNLEPSKKKKR